MNVELSSYPSQNGYEIEDLEKGELSDTVGSVD